jgi:hypothetical protein
LNTSEQAWGPWKLALRVIDEPVEVFRQIAVRPTAWVPIVLLVVATVFLSYGTPAANLQRQTREQMESAQQRSPDRITDEMIEDRVERAASVTGRAIGAGVRIAYYLIAFVVVAAVLMLIFGAMGSEPISFKQEFAIVTHAFMPQVLGFFLLVLLMRFAGFDQPTISLGFMFDPETQTFLFMLATMLHLFGLWNVVMLALGNQVKIGAKGLTGPLAVVGGLWLVWSLLFSGLLTLLTGLGGG